jgi:hypothetical protein
MVQDLKMYNRCVCVVKKLVLPEITLLHVNIVKFVLHFVR